MSSPTWAASSSAVIVTVCLMCQLEGVKVKVDGVTVAAVGGSNITVTVTASEGGADKLTSRVVVAPSSTLTEFADTTSSGVMMPPDEPTSPTGSHSLPLFLSSLNPGHQGGRASQKDSSTFGVVESSVG